MSFSTPPELLDEGFALFREWFSVDGLDDSHMRTLFGLAFFALVDARTSLETGEAENETEATQRVAAILVAAAQIGRASTLDAPQSKPADS